MTGRIHPCLWFNGNAEEAVSHYTTILPNSRITHVQRMGEGGPVLVLEFELDGRRFVALNAATEARFSEAFSIVVPCNDQAEIDRVWEALLAGGGTPAQCGWLRDRFGLSWQVIPAALPRLLADPERGGRVMTAMLKMVKLDLPTLEAA